MIGLVLFLVLPLVTAAVAYVFRRWRNATSPLAVGVSLGLGLLLLLSPLDEPLRIFGRDIMLGGAVSFLGRELILGASARAAMTFLFLTGAGLFLLAWWLEPEGLLTPVGLALLGLLGGVLLVRPLIYAALLLQIVAAFSIFPLQADPRSPVRGGLRYLTFCTLALPGLMASHWMLDMYAVTPDQVGLLYGATGLIGFSFALLLGVVPFHPWVPAVARDSAPLASAFLFSANSGTVWFLMLDYLQTYPWLGDHPQSTTVFITLGSITAVVGGLLGMTRRGPGTLMGYAVMVDTGFLLAALAQLSQTGVNLSVAIVFVRPFGLALMAAGLTGLSTADRAPSPGLGRRMPWSTIALVVGGLSLLGFPPMIGFVPRWALFRMLFRDQPSVALILFLASIGPLVGLLRLLHLLLSKPQEVISVVEEEEQQEPSPDPSEPLPVAILLFLYTVGIVALGLFPQGVMSAATRLGTSFTIFGP